MTWWRRLVGGSSARGAGKTDFLKEGLDLEARGDYGNALTSYRLALRERPDDLRVLQNIAIAFSKTGQPEEAIRTYRRALQLDPNLAGAHYGLAFLLLKRSDTVHAGMHLEAYLRTSTTNDPQAAKFREHAERTLAQLQNASMQESEQDGYAPADETQGEHGASDHWQAPADETRRDEY
jgi:tetratricopeptide (TPR) repeat protein